jgi:hypothetical protein
MGNAQLVSWTEDLPSPLFENWKSTRSLWKCFLLIKQALPGLVEQQKEALACWQTALNSLYVPDDWLCMGTKFIDFFNSEEESNTDTKKLDLYTLF